MNCVRSVSVTALDQADCDFLLANAREGQALKLGGFHNLDQPIGVWNYIRIANDIARQVPQGRLLDWGCGYGQMTYLLRRRGFIVTAFDVGSPDATVPDVPLCRDLSLVRVEERTRLPFEDASFDAVLSCGVLEHVDEFSQPGNEIISLREIARVLRPRGTFFIYQLPQRYGWQEAIIRGFKLGYAHPRRYTATEIIQMLHDTGYHVNRVRRANLVAKNLTGMPTRLRAFYSRFARPLILADGWLCRVPLLNQVAGVLEISARRVL
jgi:SAM-dependent methyltransferase